MIIWNKIMPSASILWIATIDNVHHALLNKELSEQLNKKYNPEARDMPYLKSI